MRSPFGYLKIRVMRFFSYPAINAPLVGLFYNIVETLKDSKISDYLFKKSDWYYIMLGQALRLKGDYDGAFQALTKGLRGNLESYQLHLKLSESYRENVEISSANEHLGIAERLKPGYSTIRKLVFETDHMLLDDGSQTMARALELPLEMLRSHIGMLDRVSIHYPEHHDQLTAIREELMASLKHSSYSSSKDLTEAVSKAITMRRLRLALEISHGSKFQLSPIVHARLARLEKNLGDSLLMLDVAWDNEIANDPVALVHGEPVALSKVNVKKGKVVELFVPVAIFDYPKREKQTHETIRETFFHIIRILSDRDDLILVPRMQLNWRQCFPKTQDAYVISYHTSATVNPLRLHVQESPFAGYSSLDHSGFAGYATIAFDHTEITKFVSDVSDNQLEKNQRELYDRYVTHNISKYKQASNSNFKPIPSPYVFVALQVSTDIVAKLGWMSGIELLESVVAHYRGTEMKVVVKRHPFCRSIKVQKCLLALESTGEIIQTDDSIHSILKDAEVVFAVNSGVGLESLVHGKTVIVSGACDYCYATKTAKTREELHQILSSDLTPDKRRIQQLLYFYVHRFAVPSSDVKRIKSRLDDWLK